MQLVYMMSAMAILLIMEFTPMNTLGTITLGVIGIIFAIAGLLFTLKDSKELNNKLNK